MGHRQGRQPHNEMDRLGHHPKSRGSRSSRGCGATWRPRGVRGIPGQSVAGAAKSSAQAADAELKSCDGAKTMSEMEASVPSEQELRLAAEAVNMKAEGERLQAELALRVERQHRAWKEQWPCNVDGAVYIMSLYIASYVAFFRTGIVYSSSSRYQVPGVFPGYVHTPSNPSPDPDLSALEHRTRTRAPFNRFGYAVSRQISSRTRAPIVLDVLTPSSDSRQESVEMMERRVLGVSYMCWMDFHNAILGE